MVERGAWRILLALDPARIDPASLELAALLAAREEGEMLALWVEDPALFRLAELPFGEETGRGGAERRPLRSARLARLWRLQVEQLRRDLQRLAEESRIVLSERSVRGGYLAEALGAAEANDVVFLCREASVGVRLGAVHSSRKRVRDSAPVHVVYRDDANGRRTLSLAAAVATAEQRALNVVLPTSEAGEAVSWQERVEAAPELRDIPTQFIVIDPNQCPFWVARLTRDQCRLLVACRGEPALATCLGNAIHCPVVLVG